MTSSESLLAVCVRRTGSQLKGGRVAAFIVAWGLARDALGREITVDEYAAWWKQSRRTAFREQATFREVFAPLRTPDPLLDQLKSPGLGEAIDVGSLALS